MPFGDWLQEKRIASGLSLRSLAKKAGVSHAYIDTLEKNKPHPVTGALPQPTKEIVLKLAKACNASVDDALTAADYLPSPRFHTLVFIDMEEATKKWEAHGNSFYQYVLKHDALLEELAERYDGEVVKGTGDGFFFAFDRAEKAVQFAMVVQQELPKQEWQQDLSPPIRVRIGMRTGRLIFNEPRNDYLTHVANEAARVTSVTPAGCIFVCNATRDEAWAARLGSYEFVNLGIHTTKENVELWLYQVQYEGYKPASPIDAMTERKSLVRVENVPYERNEYFTGREDVLATLYQTIETGTPLAITQALHGLGGIGKTQTAVEYFYRYGERYSAVLWCRADTADALNTGYAELARTLELPEARLTEQPEIVTAVVNWLGDPAHRGYLLILDNADDPDLLEDFLPRFPKKLQGHILLTSRKDRFKATIKPVPVPHLTTEEAVAFLFARTGRDRAANPDEEAKAQKLAEALGGLPLALEQAAAYIKEMGRTFAVYLHEYRTRRGKMEEVMRAPEMGEYRRYEAQTNEFKEHLTVWTTWGLNFEDVERNAPASAELLKLSAFLAPDAIPMELVMAVLPGEFTEARSEEDKERIFGDLLLPLTRYSLATVGEKSFSVHRMVQTVLQDRMTPDKRGQAQEAILRLLNAVTPDPRQIANWPLLERLRLHVLVCASWTEADDIATEGVARLLNRMAFYLYQVAAYTEATPLCVRALAICEQVLGSQHPDTAQSLNILAELYRVRGRFEEAEPLYMRALAVREQVLGSQHPDTAQSLNNLALLYYRQGRFVEATPLCVRALAICEQVLGSQHPDTAQSLNILAELYRVQERFAEAEPLYVRALAIREQVLGQQHPSTATSLNNLARLYVSQGRFAEAEPLYMRALAIRKQVLGSQHPSTATSLNNLARLYVSQGRFEEAEPLYVRALAIREQVLGQQHPDMATSLNNLARLYVSQGRFAEAEPLYMRALVIREQVYGLEYPDTRKIAEYYRVCKEAMEGQK
jgi:class 3 adenylate cyclase/tetratricopeptide (TPR) repeat protein